MTIDVLFIIIGVSSMDVLPVKLLILSRCRNNPCSKFIFLAVNVE